LYSGPRRVIVFDNAIGSDLRLQNLIAQGRGLDDIMMRKPHVSTACQMCKQTKKKVSFLWLYDRVAYQNSAVERNRVPRAANVILNVFIARMTMVADK
jgi:hypothetical protein